MKDIKLFEYGDIRLTQNGDISIEENPAQAVRIRLRWFLNEWRFNPELGLPYFEEVFVKSPNLERIEQLVAEQIRSVEGVTSVVSVVAMVDAAQRKLAISFEAIAGEEKIKEEVTINV